MKIFLIVLLISMTIACAKPVPPQLIYETVEVEVVVYKEPEFTIPPKPVLPTSKLNWSNVDDHNVVGKAYFSTVKILDNYATQLRNLLEGIKKGEDQ